MSVPPNGSLGCCSDELDAGALEATVALLWVVHQNPDATTDDATTTVGSRFRDCLSTDQQLVLYGLYKRATTTEPTPASSSPSEDGLQPDPPPPSFWNVKAHRKHQAWRDCAGTMSVPEARMAYVRFVAAEAERHRNVHQDIQWLYEACGSLLADRVVYTASSPPTTTNTMNASNGESSSASIGQTETDTTNSANVDIGETCTLAPSEPLDDDGPPKTPQGSICRSRSPSPHSSKAESSKQEVLPKTDDCFPAARNCGRLERRCQAFVSHTLGIEPLIPRGPIDMAWPDWSFAANHCLLATQWSHQQQRRCYERTEQQIVNQWQRALRNSSLPPLDSTTNTTMPKERTTKGDGPNPPEEKEEDDDVVVGLSVRSLLDLYLRVQQYPVGSEVIISPPINVPGMWQVFQHHGLKMVGVDLPSSTKDDDDDDDDERGLLVAVDCNAVVNAITPSTVAIVVVHVFGIIAATEADMLAIRQAAKSYKTKGSLTTEISILEDCSECFSGLEKGCYLGSHHADLSFFSFGLIKTMTCVSGGIVVLRQDDSVTAVKRGSPIAVSMRRLQASSNEPPQTNVEFLWKLVKCLILRAIAQSPLLYGLVVFIIDRIFRIDFDCFVAGVLRGFPPIEKQGQRRRLGAESRKANIELQFQRMIKQIRRRPSTSMLALMHRRLTQSKTTKKAVSERMKYGELLSNRILQMSSNNSGRLCVPIPRIGCRHLHWLCPVVVDDPSIAAKHLRQSGFDATEGASQLCCIEEHSDVCFPRANDLMKNVLYLPQTVGSKDAMDRMLSALKGRKSLRDCRRRKNSFRLQHLSTYANLKLFVAFCAILSALPWTRRVLLTSFALGIFAILSSTVLTLLLLWILRMSMGQFYLKASYGIAKYSELISFGLNGKIGTSRTKGSDDAAHQVPTILGSLKILQLSHNLEMQGKRSVFLTGGSGFVGSLLLRDLLFYRRVLRIEKVFLLLRTKNGTNGKARIVALLNDPMFSFLSDTEKVDIVSVVEGDTTKPNAGVKDDEINHIRHNYNITHIFHCAASVSFTQSLPEAAHANVSSALHLQNLSACLSSSHVQFVHISTAFVHGSLSGNEIEPLPEELHSLGKFDPFEIYRSMCNAQFYASKAMHELGFANTYTFSKCIAEHLLLVNDPTTIIIRPSIIGPAVEVPYEGWAGRVPSTLVAAAALYLSYQWNLWSFSCQSVPCIPVDVVSRYILAKAFMTVTSEERDVDSIETSSDEGYEKVARDSSPSHDIARASYPLYVSQGPRIYAAAWDSTSDAKASFTWFNYAGAVTQVGAVTGHFSRATAYLGLLVATRLLPNAALSVDQFKTLHSVFVKFPFDLVCGLYNWAGRDTSRMMRLLSVLDLPLLFYPFMNTGYYFQSELIAPSDLSGERYLFSCVAAAHTFVAKASSKSNGLTIVLENQPPKKIRSIDLTCLSIAGSDHSGCLINMLWAITQPKGSWCVRVAGFVLAMILHWCFREVTVDIESFAAVKRCNDDSNPPCIVLVPTHRSIFDFLLLSYVSFAIPELQLGIPNIAAAEEFSRLPIMGGILHLLGAFFLRRGRSSVDPDLANMISKIKLKSSEPDSCIEVFIEGTRSRDRRFVQPKTGFLRCLCKGGGRFAMLPISISYERIAEQESLIREASGEQVPRMCLISMFSWAMVRHCILLFAK